MEYTWNYIPGNKCTKYNVFALHNIFYINQYKIYHPFVIFERIRSLIHHSIILFPGGSFITLIVHYMTYIVYNIVQCTLYMIWCTLYYVHFTRIIKQYYNVYYIY